MSSAMRRVTALVRNDVRLLLSDPVPTAMLPLMALGLMAFLKSTFREVVDAVYGPGFSGAEQAVPGMAVMFGFFLVANGAFGVFREHGWNTWTRLRASALSSVEVLVGKGLMPLMIAVAYLAVAFTAGRFLFGLHLRGSLGPLVIVCVSFSICLAALSLAMVSVSRTVMQVNALGSITALVFAGLGGALAPREVLPGWAQTLGPISPGYWAMSGYGSVFLRPSGARAFESSVMLIGFATIFAVVAALRFRFDERKIGPA